MSDRPQPKHASTMGASAVPEDDVEDLFPDDNAQDEDDKKRGGGQGGSYQIKGQTSTWGGAVKNGTKN